MLLHQDQVFTKQVDLQRQEDLKARMQLEVSKLKQELDENKEWPQDVYRQKQKDIAKIEERIKKNIDPNMLTICDEINQRGLMVAYLKRYAMRELAKTKRFWFYIIVVLLLVIYLMIV